MKRNVGQRMIIYLNWFLFLTALIGWGWLVFGEHMTAAQFRKECCAIGEHKYSKAMRWLSLPKPGTPSVWMVSQHCAHCGNYKTWIENDQ